MKRGTFAVVAAWVLAGALVSGCKQDRNVNAESPAPTSPGNTAPTPPGPSAAPSTQTAPDTTSPAPGTPEANSADHLAALKVKNALMTSNKSIAAKNITVTYEAGTIHLRGTVPSAAQKTAAEKVARQSAGGTPVMNHLTVGK